MLYEELLAITKDNSLNEVLNGAYIIDASNVWQYIKQQGQQLTNDDFPNVAPPFERMFIEYRDEVRKIGMAIRSFDLQEYAFEDVFPQLKEQPCNPVGARWVSIFVLFVRDDSGFLILEEKGPSIEAANWFIVIDGNGRICKDARTGGDCIVVHYPSQVEDPQSTIGWTMATPLLTLAFMHCKNVTVIPKGQGTRAGKRHRHGPRLRYHVLEIEPMKKILRTEGNSEQHGLKKALHICRGHFKDYRESGLFGRNKGIYWWDAHVRGDINTGVVDKDYSVNPSKDISLPGNEDSQGQ